MKKLTNTRSWLFGFLAIGLLFAACGSSTVSKKVESENTGTSATSAAGSSVAQQPVAGNTAKTIIVDVRTVDEWNGDGHADCTINIPLQEFEQRMSELKGYGKVVLVCRSGGRAGKAKDLLVSTGYMNVENLGAWQNVKCQ
jgi:phage shock protein E